MRKQQIPALSVETPQSHTTASPPQLRSKNNNNPLPINNSVNKAKMSSSSSSPSPSEINLNSSGEGGRFDAELINNRYHLSSLLATPQFEDENETREPEEDEKKEVYSTTPNQTNDNPTIVPHLNEAPSPRTATPEKKNPLSSQMNRKNNKTASTNISSEDGNTFAGPGSLPSPTLDQLPIGTNLEALDEQDVNEMPTWLRKLSIFQNYSFNNDTNSNRWKDIKQAFNKKFRKDSQVPPGGFSQRKDPLLFPESEAQARMRASNLITSLLAGSPAALFAGMSFTTDEHSDRRAPLLLSLLGLEVKEISTTRGHHKKFQIELEYGVGDNRLKWSVVKDLRALISLHSKLKVSLFQLKNIKGRRKIVELPKFPKFNEDFDDHEHHKGATLNDKYLSERNVERSPSRNNFQSFQDAQQINNLISRNGYANGNGNIESLYNESPNRETPPHSQSSIHPHTVHTNADDSFSNHSITSSNNNNNNGSGAGAGGFRNRLHSIVSRASFAGSRDDMDERDYIEQHEMFRRRIESYLKQLIATFSLQPQANRLFQFFELSPIGVLLSYETGYQGKQGYLIVGTSAKSQGWRVGHLKLSDLKQMVKRHTNKWFLVRDSYIMYVSGIYSTTPLEVFLVDSEFKVTFAGKGDHKLENLDNESIYDDAISLDDRIENTDPQSSKVLSTHFVIRLENGERSMKIFAKSENQAKLWVQSIETMRRNTIFAQKNRFYSFAPVRNNCYAQWFVDGRDHFWAIASALELAKDVIYIHDWWLSPELYLRRPANGNQEWRLDRVLKRKAEEGVKIFVIVYRNVGNTVVTDSLWTKHSLIDLHPNVHILRSPTQWLQNTYFWAHHEKLCIIDHTVAFVGGIDLCYGRYDTPDHVLVDDSPYQFATDQDGTVAVSPEEAIKYQNFPGKDYSNPRVRDFYELDKPYESMYDRQVTPRMPWHDVHMMTAGQPASDLSRHFVQRWNYILRQKRPSRPTPLLAPPPDWNEETLRRFNLSGTCEVQLVRSAGNWSLGLKDTECSIQNAYLKLIETSDHFVYMENQFFITATAFDGVVIENRIGDALVDRIIRAHNEKKPWRAVVIIPLMPGFEAQVDQADGSAVRVIMKCQYMSISRGEASIFGKLQKMNINPYQYIQFFSLRKWGRIGPSRRIVTEQLYIHSKILLVDDCTALIGSANINERSQRGNRDSEVACIVRDTETIETTMNGKPYKAGRFAHTLRMRLMREHVGIDVDTLEIVEKRFKKIEEMAAVNTGHKTHNFSNKEYEIASSKVELASRDVLNLPDGTDKWKKYKQQQSLSSQFNSDPSNSTKVNAKNSNSIKLGDNRLNMSSSSIPPTLLTNSNNSEHPHSSFSSPSSPPKELPKPIFIHSFNNRAREENLGIREKKQFSGDSRITHNTAHKKDVEGKGIDRMGSKEYGDHKINAAKTLRQWADESLANDSTKLFLPNVDQVLEFLDDDCILGGNIDLTQEEELWIHERNKERWNMLKRITYLQRVAAKQQKQTEEENLKRVKTGLPNLLQKVSNNSCLGTEGSSSTASTSAYAASKGQGGGVKNVISEHAVEGANSREEPLASSSASSDSPDANQSPKMSSNRSSTFNPSSTNTSSSARDFSLGGLDKVEEIGSLPGHNIPVISLDSTGIREVLAKTTYNPEAINDTKYIDPYLFGDPLAESFYEDVWFDVALKNTLIYREVFHCQPDDTVTTWRQYKEFTRLGTAFSLAQDQEISARERDLAATKRSSTLSPSIQQKSQCSTASDNASDIESDTRSINMDVIDEEMNKTEGILGKVPPVDTSTAGGEPESFVESPLSSGGSGGAAGAAENRTKSTIYGIYKKITRGDHERVFDIATAERLLDEVQGHLVLFPVDWLYKEIDGGNWFYNMDRIPPIEIYD